MNKPLTKKLSRAEKAILTKESIYQAAAEIVGEHGYVDASVSRITERAGIAQGTFYRHFESRQELFDHLLPHVGAELIVYLRERVGGSSDYFDMEEKAFRAFFDFLELKPGFFRVLNEAEVVAPVAYKKHFDELVKHYLRSLNRGVKRDEIKHFAGKELEALAYMLMSTRSYLYLRYIKNGPGAKKKKMPVWLIDTYMKFVRDGIR